MFLNIQFDNLSDNDETIYTGALEASYYTNVLNVRYHVVFVFFFILRMMVSCLSFYMSNMGWGGVGRGGFNIKSGTAYPSKRMG